MSDEGQSSQDTLSNLSHEDRRFPPPEDLAASANVTAATYEQAAADPGGFWAEQAKRISWEVEPTEVLDWSNPPFAKWFADGTLNAAYNAWTDTSRPVTATGWPSTSRASPETPARSRTRS